MKQFCEWKGENVFEYLPLTFHIRDGLSDPEYSKFEDHYYKLESELKDQKARKGMSPAKIWNTWIVKPGENTNRGSGIQFCKDIESVRDIISKAKRLANGEKRSYIV